MNRFNWLANKTSPAEWEQSVMHVSLHAYINFPKQKITVELRVQISSSVLVVTFSGPL